MDDWHPGECWICEQPGVPVAWFGTAECGVDISSVSAPRVQAMQTEQADIQPGMRVLESMHQAMDKSVTDWARRVAEAELSGALPRRWAHSQGVAARAADLVGVLGEDAGLLVASAVLHDVGYAPRLAATGFHPLDGARFLRDEYGVDERLTRLVANHSFALLEAEERGLREVLAAEFPLLDRALLVDALVYCDMTTTPDGEPTTAQKRVAEILSRYGDDSVVGRFIRRAAPEIFAAVERVNAALAAQPR